MAKHSFLAYIFTISLLIIPSSIHTGENIQESLLAITLLSTIDSTKIDSAFAIIATNKEKSFMFQDAQCSINENFLKPFYFGQTFDFKNILKSLNTNTIALETTNKLLAIYQITTGTVAIPLITLNILYSMAEKLGISFYHVYEIFKYGVSTVQVPIIVFMIIQGLIAYSAFRSLQTTEEVSNYLQDILISTNAHINALKTLSSQVKNNPELLQHLPSLQPLANFNNPTKRSAKLNKLLGMLNTNTFVGKPSFWSITGRVFAAYELMKQVKDELTPVCAAADELNKYVTLTKH